MRIISWNVNGIRATTNKWELQNLITTYDPDILFMQEIKAGHDKITSELKYPEPYTAHYNPAEKAWYAGTGAWIHSRVYESYDVEFMDSFPEDPTANEWRVAHVCLVPKASVIAKNEAIQISKNTEHELLRTSQWQENKVIHLFGIYFPNGGKSEQAWQDKLVFYTKFASYMDELRASGASVIWGGDINCAHHAIDLARPEANDGKIGFHPLERAWLDGRVQGGWHDIWRERNPTMTDVYSWWDPVTRSRERNVWWRIDALWCDTHTIADIRNISYLPNQMGSDHCPILLDI
jgi:exodeoxyribonuclease III